MFREIDLNKTINENSEKIGGIAAAQVAPTMSLAQAKKDFPKIDITLSTFDEMKRRGINSLTKFLEQQDSSYNYKPMQVGSKLIWLDAFERQLLLRDLVVSGPDSVELDAFYSTENRFLFPEFINRNILMGALLSEIDLVVSDLVGPGAEVEIDSQTYESAIVKAADQNAKLADVKEGSAFPVINIVHADREVRLKKFGGAIKSTYEILRRIRANIFALTLQFIGMQYEKDQADMALDVCLNGNTGNSNSAPNTNTAVTGTLAFSDMVRWRLKFRPFGQMLLVASETRGGDIMLMEEFKDPVAGFNYQGTGEPISPFGKKLRLNDSIGNTKLAGVDNRFSLEKLTEKGGSITETDKIINGQWNEIVFSNYIGFSKMYAEATRVLTVNW